jgi:inosine-uridine nucleoside N-ribohydrolase
VTLEILLPTLLGTLLVMEANATGADRLPVVLTTDCGTEVDDQWALAHLALSPEIDLRGVITTHAPNLKAPAAETSAKAARELLGVIVSKSKPVVLPGSSRALGQKSQPLLNPGVAFLLDQARGFDANRRLTVLVIGAATDVASALLADPSLADRIRIIAMGFDAWPDGKDPWNIKNDVYAWQVLLESRAPIVVGDTTVTRRHLSLTNAQIHALLSDRHEPGATLLRQWETWWARRAKNPPVGSSRTDDWTIWDEVTVAYLLGLTETATYPRPRLRDDLTFDQNSPHGTIEWITAIDSRRLWDDLRRKLGPR